MTHELPQGLFQSHLPVGTVVPYAGPLPGQEAFEDGGGPFPPITAQGWLYCDGAAYRQVEYAELFRVIGELYGGDASTGEFQVPDLRGMFVRGFDDGRGKDHEGDRALGSDQEDTFQEHTHGEPIKAGTVPPGDKGAAPVMVPGGETDTNTIPEGRHSAETAPKNVCMNFLIKAR